MKWRLGMCGLWWLPLATMANAQERELPSVVRCESRDMARVHCPMNTDNGVQLVRQLSENTCIRGSEWDADTRGVWVAFGCRAEFAPTRLSATPQMRRVVRCESDGRTNSCPVILRGAPVRLSRSCRRGRARKAAAGACAATRSGCRAVATASSRWAPRTAPGSSTCRA